jgi:hypothetical protein
MRIGRGNRRSRRKPAPVLLSTIYPSLPDLGSNPGRGGGRPAINRLCCGTTKEGRNRRLEKIAYQELHNFYSWTCRYSNSLANIRSRVQVQNLRNRDSSVGIATCYDLAGRGSIPGRRKRFLSSPQRPDRLWGSPSLTSNGHRRLFPQG